MKRKFSLVMSAAMILSLIAPMTNALAEDIQTPETATPETVVTEDAASGGTTYYVDSTIGDDSNSGTSPETPWKSLDKVTATTFLPGDTILLKSGSVWNGEWLWPKGSGTADAPIKIDFRWDLSVSLLKITRKVLHLPTKKRFVIVSQITY